MIFIGYCRLFWKGWKHHLIKTPNKRSKASSHSAKKTLHPVQRNLFTQCKKPLQTVQKNSSHHAKTFSHSAKNSFPFHLCSSVRAVSMWLLSHTKRKSSKESFLHLSPRKTHPPWKNKAEIILLAFPTLEIPQMHPISLWKGRFLTVSAKMCSFFSNFLQQSIFPHMKKVAWSPLMLLSRQMFDGTWHSIFLHRSHRFNPRGWTKPPYDLYALEPSGIYDLTSLWFWLFLSSIQCFFHSPSFCYDFVD